MPIITDYRQLRVFQNAIDAAMKIFELSKRFPADERYSMTDQVRRSSRSVCTNIGEAWRKRRYAANFVSKLSDSETEAEETRIWLELARRCKYVSDEVVKDLDGAYDFIIGQLVKMIDQPEKWVIRKR